MQAGEKRPRSAPKRWQEHLESILTKAGVVSNQFHPCLWTQAEKRTALAHHVDDQLMVGTRQSIQELHAEFSTDLEIVAVKSRTNFLDTKAERRENNNKIQF